MMENNLVLPAEVWTEVFSHLSDTQKLISRLVCKEWNRQISKYLAKTYFSVESIESHEALLDSDVSWTKLKIGEYSSSGFALTAKFRNLITSIQLKISESKECMAIIIRLPHLADLDMTIKEDRNKKKDSKNSENSEISQELKESFEKSLEKLKNLSITFPFRHYDALYNLVDGFRGAKISLVGLKIQEEEHSYDYNSSTVGYHSRQWALEQIYSIICKSSQTLISLDLEINAQRDQIQSLSFSELISKLTTLEGLKLQTVRIQIEPSDEYEDRDFTAWQNFLKSQTKMKNVILPSSYRDSLTVSREFVLSLPRDLESIQCVTDEHVTDEFWTTFTKLERISIASCKPSMFKSNDQYPSVRIIQMNFREEFDMLTEDADIFYRNLSNSFVNLAELHIVTYGEYFYNRSQLQLVIRHLNQLRVLEMDDCNFFDDNAVTGINENYIDELSRTGRIYRCLEVPKEQVEGLPLSSLKSLEKLVLLKSHITDSGIYYGLQFGPRLKHLSFGVSGGTENVKVTEWGIHWLAAGNPALEVFDVSLANQTISKNGIEDLRRILENLTLETRGSQLGFE